MMALRGCAACSTCKNSCTSAFAIAQLTNTWLQLTCTVSMLQAMCGQLTRADPSTSACCRYRLPRFRVSSYMTYWLAGWCVSNMSQAQHRGHSLMHPYRGRQGHVLDLTQALLCCMASTGFCLLRLRMIDAHVDVEECFRLVQAPSRSGRTSQTWTSSTSRPTWSAWRASLIRGAPSGVASWVRADLDVL